MTLGKLNNLNIVIRCFDYLTPRKGIFKPIAEALEQHHSIVDVTYKGITMISSQRLELKLLKHSETCILIGNGYIPSMIVIV
jgi:hypothetical protein